jgi:hypothetical protein
LLAVIVISILVAWGFDTLSRDVSEDGFRSLRRALTIALLLMTATFSCMTWLKSGSGARKD